jgi:hypothetical protein
MLDLRRRTRDGCIACAAGIALLLAVLTALPTDEGACAQVSARWSQLNAWSSPALLRPFALLLQAC